MILRYIKLAAAIILSLIFTISLARLVISIWNQFNGSQTPQQGWPEVEVWLEQNQFDNYKELFRGSGKHSEETLRGEYNEAEPQPNIVECVLYLYVCRK